MGAPVEIWRLVDRRVQMRQPVMGIVDEGFGQLGVTVRSNHRRHLVIRCGAGGRVLRDPPAATFGALPLPNGMQQLASCKGDSDSEFGGNHGMHFAAQTGLCDSHDEIFRGRPFELQFWQAD